MPKEPKMKGYLDSADVDNMEIDGANDHADVVDEDNMLDIINVLQEFKKQKSLNTACRSNVFQRQKKEIIAAAHQQAENMLLASAAYIEDCKTSIRELRCQESKPASLVKDLVQLWTDDESSMRSILNLFPSLIDDLSHRRAGTINSASETLELYPEFRENCRRKLIKSARKQLEIAVENQRVATDASNLIKHYKALLLS